MLAGLLLLFLLAQWASGFGLQRAVNEWVESEYADTKAAANTPEKLQRWEMQVAMKKGEYHVKTTPVAAAGPAHARVGRRGRPGRGRAGAPRHQAPAPTGGHVVTRELRSEGRTPVADAPGSPGRAGSVRDRS